MSKFKRPSTKTTQCPQCSAKMVERATRTSGENYSDAQGILGVKGYGNFREWQSTVSSRPASILPIFIEHASIPFVTQTAVQGSLTLIRIYCSVTLFVNYFWLGEPLNEN